MEMHRSSKAVDTKKQHLLAGYGSGKLRHELQCPVPGFSDSESGESEEHEVTQVSFDSSESMGQPAEVKAS